MTPRQMISCKRDGGELAPADITRLIQGYVDGNVPDYQMSAFAMAVYFQGMTTDETVALTKAMLESGRTLRWHSGPPRVDKHSTGGLGDKVSLILAPLLACCGLHVPMLSGRGLGITGGTLDKLEAMAGFRTDLSIPELQETVGRVGCAITGTTQELAPADRKLYALRDVTGTVPSQPLIVASIMSKKLAEGLNSLVLDVKFGSGAFMKKHSDAVSLGCALVDVGKQMGVHTTALITDMNQPLGKFVGNAVEVQEAIDALRGCGPSDVLELTLSLGSVLLLSAGVADSEDSARQLQLNKIADGSAFEKFEAMVHAQGGAALSLEFARETVVTAAEAGVLKQIDCNFLGNFVIELGGGRRVMGDQIDHGVGLEVLVEIGDSIGLNQPLLKVFSRGDYDRDGLLQAFKVQSDAVKRQKLIYERVE